MHEESLAASSTPCEDVEPIKEHPRWSQLQEVVRESCKVNKMGGKLRRLSRSEKVEQEDAATALLGSVAEMPLNDALQTLSRKLCVTIPELMHEWNFEVDWQSSWDSQTQKMTAGDAGVSASSSSSQR